MNLNLFKRSKENETRLLKESKEYLKKLDENKSVLQKVEAFPDNLTTEVLKLRAQYLKYENDSACSEERLYNLDYKLAGLEEDKNLLEREYARMPKPHELERRIDQLTQQNKDLTREITQRKEEISDLKRLIYDKNAHLDAQRKEYKELVESVEDHKNDYVQANAQPHQIAKEIDKIITEKELVASFIIALFSSHLGLFLVVLFI
jgi:chromosome segregation ATPase